MMNAEEPRPMPTREHMRKPARATAGRVTIDRLKKMPILDIHPDASGRAEIELNGALIDTDFVADYLLDAQLVGTFSGKGETHSILKILPADFLAALASRPPGQPEKDDNGTWWSITQEDSITVRRGNRWGHLCNLSRLATRESGGAFFQALADADIHSIAYPKTTGSIAQSILANHADFPDLKRPPEAGGFPYAILQAAHNADKGGRMEARQLGTFESVWCYDYTSAYAGVMATLPDCDPFNCRWVQGKDYQPSAFYGFARCKVGVPDHDLSPLCFRSPGAPEDYILEGLRFPYGEGEVWLAKPELDLLIEYGCKVEILEGAWGFPAITALPFAGLVRRLYSGREDPKASPGIKILLTAMVGKLSSYSVHTDSVFGATTTNVSPAFNPVYASHIRSKVRANLARQAYAFGVDCLVCLTIDGLVTTREIPGITPERRLGELRLDGHGPMTILTDYIKDRPGETHWRDNAELTAMGSSFSRPFTFYGRLGLFNTEMSLSQAHSALGLPMDMRPEFQVGSTVRTSAVATASDYLSGVVGTKVSHIAQASAPPMAAWAQKILAG